MEIRKLQHDEHGEWLHLRESLWPGTSPEELGREQEEILSDPGKTCVFVAPVPGGLVGFVEVALRDWAEGRGTRPVGYIEAWYVKPEHRHSGIGRELMRAGERWTLSRGCTEMGSDAALQQEARAVSGLLRLFQGDSNGRSQCEREDAHSPSST